ncbi:hypothetical protein, partial [Streptomyces syringium]
LALTFGTLLSSQGTDASFVLTLSGFPPGASLRYFVFRLYQILFRAVPGSNFVSDPHRRGFAFLLSLSGDSDFIRFVPAELIGLSASNKESKMLGVNSIHSPKRFRY